MAGKEPCPPSSCYLGGQLDQALLAQELLFIAKSFPTLCNPMDYSSPAFSVHVISQARILDLVAISFPTGSYNYGSYGNQHPPPMQSQYPALPHDTAISGPLHYSPYHRSSAQVSRWSCLPAQALVSLVPGLVNTISTFCILCVQPLCLQGKAGLFLSATSSLPWLPTVGAQSASSQLAFTYVGTDHVPLVLSSL